MSKMKIAVLISGRGTNLQALINASKAEDYPAEIAVVISNKPEAQGLMRAKEAGLETLVIDHKKFPDRESFEEELHTSLKKYQVKLICLAGFMRILNANFVNRWRDRIVNIHPSLLPAFKGLHTHERALETGVKFTGCTIHFVRPEMDDGPIIMQAAVPVAVDDTTDSLALRILHEENKLYPEAVKLLASGQVRVANNKVVFREAPEIVKPISNPPV